MFVDEIVIKAVSGSGGDGCTSFRREKFIPMGGPDGGNGGRGSNIIFKTDKNLKTLIDLRYLKNIKGKKGENGKGSNMYGANAEDIIIKVPMGTVISDNETNLILSDLTHDNEEVILIKGGRGGKGNKAFATHDNPAPKYSEKGEPGEERILKLELKMLADVGLVGMPSVGKSTILSIISSSKPKIAAYHFTTLSPNLGVVKLKDNTSFVMADLPGLIEGASEGIGLGDSFLKHASRTKILAHVIDIGAEEGRDPINDYEIIRNEIEKYDKKIANKKEIIVANKMDLPNAQDNLKKFQEKYPSKEIFAISSLYNQNVDKLIVYLKETLDKIENENLYDEEEFEDFVLYKIRDEKPYKITKEGNLWIVSGEKVEKLLKMTKFTESEGVLRFGRILRKMGIEDELSSLGAIPGDEVKILDYIFIFKS